MGKQLIHRFAKCGHTTETDNCVPPPKKLMKTTEFPSSRDNLVLWDLYCMDCDWKYTVEKAVCERMREQIAIMEQMRVPKDKVGNMQILVKRYTPQADKRDKIIRFIYHVRTTNKEGKEFWRPYKFIARPARSLDGFMSHKWKAWLAEAKKEDSKWWLCNQVCMIELEISEILEAFERRWNEDPYASSVR